MTRSLGTSWQMYSERTRILCDCYQALTAARFVQRYKLMHMISD